MMVSLQASNKFAQANSELVPCNLCGGTETIVLYPATRTDVLPANYNISRHLVSHRTIVRCSGCELVFVNPQPSAEELRLYYTRASDTHYLEDLHHRRKAFARIIELLEPYRGKGRLLEVGCFTGHFLEQAEKAGWEVMGVEPSRWAVRIAREELELPVFHTTLEEASLPETSFDAIVMLDVIEHLANPCSALNTLAQALRTGGVIFLTTPNIGSLTARLLGRRWYCLIDAHLYFYAPQTAEKLLRGAGLTILHRRSHGRTFTLGSWAQRLDSYMPRAYRLLKPLTSIPIVNHRPLYVNLFDQMAILAQKCEEAKPQISI